LIGSIKNTTSYTLLVFRSRTTASVASWARRRRSGGFTTDTSLAVIWSGAASTRAQQSFSTFIVTSAQVTLSASVRFDAFKFGLSNERINRSTNPKVATLNRVGVVVEAWLSRAVQGGALVGCVGDGRITGSTLIISTTGADVAISTILTVIIART
jgi:hypothetical protein